MARGRPPRKILDPEILPPEDEQPRGRKKLVEAEHTIKYTSPVPVTVEENPEDADLLFEDDPAEIEKKQKRKTAKTERDELRKKLMSHGVTAASTLKLIIERYLHSDGPDSGTMAEKAHCTKYGCTEAHVLNQDYMDVAAKWGAGRYWFTLYKDFAIVSQWEKRLEPPRQAPSQIIQHSIPGDPNSPQVIVQMPEGSNHPAVQVDPFKEAERALNLVEKYNKAFGMLRPQATEQPAPIAPLDPEVAALQLIAKNPDVMEKLGAGIAKTVLGSAGVKDEDPWANVALEIVKSGQAAQVVRELVSGLFNGFGTFFPRKDNNNGQAQMATAPLQNQPGSNTDGVSTRETIPQSEESLQAGNDSGLQNANMGGAQGDSHSPEDQALQLVIEHCQKKLPPQIAFTRLMAYADAVNEQYPQGSIDSYIFDYLGKWDVDAVLAFVKTLPNGEAIVALDHTKAWTEQLQKLIRESQEGGENA